MAFYNAIRPHNLKALVSIVLYASCYILTTPPGQTKITNMKKKNEKKVTQAGRGICVVT